MRYPFFVKISEKVVAPYVKLSINKSKQHTFILGAFTIIHRPEVVIIMITMHIGRVYE